MMPPAVARLSHEPSRTAAMTSKQKLPLKSVTAVSTSIVNAERTLHLLPNTPLVCPLCQPFFTSITLSLLLELWCLEQPAL